MFVGVESPPVPVFASMAKQQKANLRGKMPADLAQKARLIRLREHLGYPNATAFAQFLGIGQQRWSNFENGMPLSREIAFRLVQTVPGLTLDWLYFGKAEGLPVDLARSLGALAPPGKRSTP